MFVALATLALNTRAPWPVLLEMLEDFKKRKPAAADLKAFINEHTDRLRAEREALIDVMLGVELPGLEEMFRDRGAVESGMRSIISGRSGDASPAQGGAIV